MGLKYTPRSEKPYSSFRRCTIRRFPFSIFYTIEEDIIVIHAIFDNRQDPVDLPKFIFALWGDGPQNLIVLTITNG